MRQYIVKYEAKVAIAKQYTVGYVDMVERLLHRRLVIRVGLRFEIGSGGQCLNRSRSLARTMHFVVINRCGANKIRVGRCWSVEIVVCSVIRPVAIIVVLAHNGFSL